MAHRAHLYCAQRGGLSSSRPTGEFCKALLRNLSNSMQRTWSISRPCTIGAVKREYGKVRYGQAELGRTAEERTSDATEAQTYQSMQGLGTVAILHEEEAAEAGWTIATQLVVRTSILWSRSHTLFHQREGIEQGRPLWDRYQESFWCHDCMSCPVAKRTTRLFIAAGN
jgi:hypothetical protein